MPSLGLRVHVCELDIVSVCLCECMLFVLLYACLLQEDARASSSLLCSFEAGSPGLTSSV